MALAILVLREREHRRQALRGAAVALALGLALVVSYVLLNRFAWGRGALPGGVGLPSTGARQHSFREEVSYVWQLFLPRLWLRPQFNAYPMWDLWFVGFVGRFGWLDYTFPIWVYHAARVVALAVIALALVHLVQRRDALRRRLGELAVYAAIVFCLCIEIGVESYRYLISTGLEFAQARYLLPLLGLYAALCALAIRAGGRRWGPVVAAVLVMLAIGHNLYAQAITIARYYT